MTVIEHGPSIGTFRDKDIPSYIVTSDGVRHEFMGTTLAIEAPEGSVELARLDQDECVISPGLIYRKPPAPESR